MLFKTTWPENVRQKEKGEKKGHKVNSAGAATGRGSLLVVGCRKPLSLFPYSQQEGPGNDVITGIKAGM